MIPKCTYTCPTHAHRTYIRWKCGDYYSPEARRTRFLAAKKKCITCSNLVSSSAEKCRKCIGPYLGNLRLGKKLPASWRENISKGQSLEKGNNWKGKAAGYSAIHKILRKYHGNPTKCEWCGLVGSRPKTKWTVEWASRDGSYSRDILDYMGLCKKCHNKQDKLKGIKRPHFYKT